MEIIEQVISYLWGVPLTIFVILAGLWLSKCCNFFQISGIKKSIKIIKKSFKENKSSRKIISAALAGTVGAGNVAGIASAIAVGGPGAIFWMWLVAFISMGTKFAEVILSVFYRKKLEDGSYTGGPMYYIKKIPGKIGIILSLIYSIGLLVLVICDSGFVQTNTLATTINDTFNIPLYIIGIAIIVISFIIINKGFEKTCNFLKKLVPIMCLIYIVFSLIIIILNIDTIPSVLKQIIEYAFKPAPAIGGFVGASITTAISMGAARGIFANEAGMGTSATVHATTEEKNPVVQGVWGMFEVAFVSFGICTLTALLVMTTGVWSNGSDGALMVLDAFKTVFGSFGKYILCVVMVLFTFSTYLGFYVEYKTSIIYLFGEKSLKFLKYFYYVPVVFAVALPIKFIWSMADMAVGFIVIPNIIALLFLGKNLRRVFLQNQEILKLKKEE